MAAKLAPRMVSKPWGVTDLSGSFLAPPVQGIGEVWFTPPANDVLLVKLLFTGDRLSIQVHPDDEQARQRGLGSGKEECWYILDAEPHAVVGIGTVRPLDAAELRAAVLSGDIVQLMQWHPVSAGMFFHIPPGTIHAIGAGISLIEIQQNSDVTYRIHDFGRGRALQLDDGLAVAKALSYPPSKHFRVDPRQSETLVACSSFRVAHIAGSDFSPVVKPEASLLFLPITGEARIDGLTIVAGECAQASIESKLEIPASTRMLVAWQPSFWTD